MEYLCGTVICRFPHVVSLVTQTALRDWLQVAFLSNGTIELFPHRVFVTELPGDVLIGNTEW